MARPPKLIKNGEVSANLVRWALFQDGRLHCAWCGRRLTPKTVTRDHLAPKRYPGDRGVYWTREALVPACAPCNSARNNTRLVPWIRRFKRIPVSTVWMLHCFLVAHPNAARAQGLTLEFLQRVPVYRDTDAVMTRERRQYRQLEEQITEEREARLEARKETRRLAVA